MKTIKWIEIGSRVSGGNVYRREAQKILGQHFVLETIIIEATILRWRYAKPLEWFVRLARVKGEADLWIRDDFFSVLAMPFDRTNGKTLFLSHHIDVSVFSFFSRPIFWILESLFYSILRNVDAIVVVSEYWKNYFVQKGYGNVHKICNGFNLDEFTVTEAEVDDLKRTYDLQGKPIVYIGNCQKAKGVVESYAALKDLDVHLVTSGKPQVSLPARNFEGDYREYLTLLAASSVVVTMSKFLEGWNRTAHEAMLLGIPVVGSGKGGMRELLEGGGQIVCEDFADLRNHVESVLNDASYAKELGEKGQRFARGFSLEKFEGQWQTLLTKQFDSSA